MAPPSIKIHVTEMYDKFRLPIHTIFYVVFMTMIVYVSQIPQSYRKYSNNIIVRTLLFGLILLINNYVSYSHALLFALFVVLFISFSPGFVEKFENLRIIARKEQRWYDEALLGEDPELMETEKVNTEAVQSS
jgi:hypothetical protein